VGARLSSAEPLRGRAAIVTGASRGIGRAVALRLADEGADVVLNSSGSGPPGTAALAAVAAEINRRGKTRAVTSAGPVEDFEFTRELIATCVESYGRLDAVVNVAGIPSGPESSMCEVSPEEWHRQLDVHLTGTFNCCRHAVPILVEQQGGVIVNTSSDAFTGSFLGSGYGAAKGATNSLTYILAKQFRDDNVRCNAVCPSALTNMATPERVMPRMDELRRRGLISEDVHEAAKHLVGPEFVASLYAYLLSDAASSITGQVLRIDGTEIHRYRQPQREPLPTRPRDGGPLSLDEVHRFLS
jgi:NAD(P)-dependent dehydrogenase (short-subunit alcohol dehydrogenase family)